MITTIAAVLGALATLGAAAWKLWRYFSPSTDPAQEAANAAQNRVDVDSKIGDQSDASVSDQLRRWDRD